MLIRQAIAFRSSDIHSAVNLRPLAGYLLDDYGRSLTIGRVAPSHIIEGSTDYSTILSYCGAWYDIPGHRRDQLSTLYESAFQWEPLIGKHRPCIDQEVMTGREILIDLKMIANKIGDQIGRFIDHLPCNYTIPHDNMGDAIRCAIHDLTGRVY